MRIRKRSVALLSSSSSPPPENPEASGHGDEEQVNNKKEREEFLLPLVAAVMDVQAKAEAEAEISGLSSPSMGEGIPEIGVRKRRAHNWRDALLRFGEDSEEVKEGDKSDYRRGMIMSTSPEDKFKRVEYKARLREETVGLCGKCETPESSLSEKSSTRPRAQDLAMEKKKARNVDSRVSSNETIFQNSKQNMKIKSENFHGGSQCKRRNGRGWQCSQWTLVGYSLCEHHLGKSRFKHINSSEGPLGANKGSKFKQLHLVHAASPKVELP